MLEKSVCLKARTLDVRFFEVIEILLFAFMIDGNLLSVDEVQSVVEALFASELFVKIASLLQTVRFETSKMI